MTQTMLLKAQLLISTAVLLSCNLNPDAEEETDPVDSDSDRDSEEPDAGLPSDLARCAYGTGVYHNYFLDVGYAEEAVAAKIETAWTQLFEGDPDNETVYFDAGTNGNGAMAYIKDVANGDVRSEGMSYGMMIAVQLDRKDKFDALWNWSKTYMWHGDKNHPFYEYFAWNLDTEGNAIDDAPAPDGEEYFAMALYFAAGRWASGSGIYNYRQEADRLVSALKNREIIYGEYMDRGELSSDSGTPIFNPQYRMVRFSPKAGYFSSAQGDHTDPSYHLPAFYQLWSIFGPEADRGFWQEAAQASRDFFQAAAHPDTGLTPDYAHFDGTPVAASWEPDSVCFKEDARRTVMNWSMDWAWFCIDERERSLSDKLQTFFSSLGIDYDALYELNGTPLADNYYSASVIAMNATSALAATDQSRSAGFAEALWNLPVPTGLYRYYDGVLYMLAMLHVSGNFRIYSPK